MTAPDATKEPTGLDLYSRAAEAACNQVIAAYSTSFGWATKLLSPAIRQPVRNIYAMVRVADEIVDGAAAEAASLGGAILPAAALDSYEEACYKAIDDGFSTDLVLHAFAKTAKRVSGATWPHRSSPRCAPTSPRTSTTRSLSSATSTAAPRWLG